MPVSSGIDRIIEELAATARSRPIKGTLGEKVEILEELPPSDDGSIQVGEGNGPRVISSWIAFHVNSDS